MHTSVTVLLTLGSMLNYGKIQAYNYFGGNGTVTETIHQFMLLGDPTQEAVVFRKSECQYFTCRI
ncbi:MAG: hypothetical protein IPL53_22765 [Ignavibacteria bacterium]|nr:hypothetical protein [Ignavibacteria bacterium]